MKHHSGFLKLVRDAKLTVKEYLVREVKKKLDQKESFSFIDVREDSEWQKGYAQGALHLGRGVIERDIGDLISDKNTEIILYCGGGFRSALAAESLKKMGYKNVISMAGGVTSWKEAGYPVQGRSHPKEKVIGKLKKECYSKKST